MAQQIRYPDARTLDVTTVTLTDAQARLMELWRERLRGVMGYDGGHIRDRLMSEGLPSRAADMIIYAVVDEIMETAPLAVLDLLRGDS